MGERHDDHDLASIVAYADRELTGPELDAAEAQVAACPSCALLVADLRALTEVDRSVPTPARPRDYRLTVEDAARLSAMPSEPRAAASRLDPEMSILPDHPAHDPLLIAAAVDGALEGADRVRADTWLSGCAACAELHADLLAISAANRTMPTPARPRDYQLTPAAADRARGAGWRSVLARIGTPRDGLSRPLAIGLTTLGLAGLLLTSGSAFLPMSSAGGAGTILSTVGAAISDPNAKNPDSFLLPGAVDDDGVFSGQGESLASAAPSAAAAPAPSAAAASSEVAAAAPAASETPPAPGIENVAPLADGSATEASDAAVPEGGSGPSEAAAERSALAASVPETPGAIEEANGLAAPVALSFLLLVAGLALFTVRWVARRQPI